jgi:hypothetical protein
MDQPEITRLREDLEVMRQAAGVDLPFNRRDVWIMTPVTCLTGVAVALMGWWVPPQQSWMAVFPAAVLIGVWLWLARGARQCRAAEPVRWREQRYGLLWLFVFAPLFTGFVLLEVAMGMSRVAVTASATSLLGLAVAWFAVIDRTRRYYLGVALPLMALGLAIPFCEPHQIRGGAGLMVIAAGLATAAIQLWQLRGQRRATDAD